MGSRAGHIREAALDTINRFYALNLPFQSKNAANTGILLIFAASPAWPGPRTQHQGDHLVSLKNPWSTPRYCAFGFQVKSLMQKAGFE